MAWLGHEADASLTRPPSGWDKQCVSAHLIIVRTRWPRLYPLILTEAGLRLVNYRWAAAATCAMAFIAIGVDAVSAAPARVSLAGTDYSTDTTPAFTDRGPAATSTTVSDNLYLSVRDPSALAAAARSVSTPGGPDYGRYRTAAQDQAGNQLDPAQVASVETWRTSAGLTVSQPNWRVLRVSGTVGQFADAFGVTFDDYYPPAAWNASYHLLAPTTDLSVPAGGYLLSYLDR